MIPKVLSKLSDLYPINLWVIWIGIKQKKSAYWWDYIYNFLKNCKKLHTYVSSGPKTIDHRSLILCDISKWILYFFQMLLYDMGLNYFASPNLESGKSPVDSKVHFTYTNRNDSTIFDSNGTLDEASVWEAYGDIMTNMALYHFIRFIFQIKTCWFKKKKNIYSDLTRTFWHFDFFQRKTYLKQQLIYR